MMSVHGPPLGATAQSGSFELTQRALDSHRARSNTRKGLVGLLGLLFTGFLVSVSAAQTDSLLPETIRPVPASLAGPFGIGGPDLHVAGAIAAMVLMFISYVLAVNAADRLSPRAVLMTIAALYALVLLAPPLFSTDIFSYQAYGRMGALYGANPYLQGPHAIALDPLFPYIGAKWSYTPTAYGPIFTALSYVLAPLSVAASAIAYKSMAALAGLAIVALVWNAARLRGLNPVKAVALVGLNPLLVVYGIGSGHNDLLMLAVLIGGLYVTLAHRERLGGSLMVVAVGIKLTAGLLLPFAIAGGSRQGERGLGRRKLALGAGVAAALVAAFSYGLFGMSSFNVLATLQHTQSEGDWHSIPGFISHTLGLAPLGHIAGIVLAVAFGIFSLWLLRRVWRGEVDWIDGAAWATVALLATASSLLPWYVAWVLPLAALGTDRRLHRAVIVMTGVVLGIQLLGYIPHVVSFSL
jgi:alpha-1,6-mannosyltransferase